MTMMLVIDYLRDPGKSDTCPHDPVMTSRSRHGGRAAFFFQPTSVRR